MLTPERILAELDKLSILYPSGRMDAAQKAALTVIWMEDLGHLSEPVFAEAVRRARRASRFLPNTCQILEAAEAVEGDNRPRLALPHMTEAEILSSRAKGRQMLAKLREKWGIAPQRRTVQ